MLKDCCGDCDGIDQHGSWFFRAQASLAQQRQTSKQQKKEIECSQTPLTPLVLMGRVLHSDMSSNLAR